MKTFIKNIRSQKAVAIILTFAMIITMMPAISAGASKKESQELITVFVAVDSLGETNASGNAVSLSKTPIQITEGSNVTKALETVLDKKDIAYTINNTMYGDYLYSIGDIAEKSDWSKYWNFIVNSNMASVGMGSYYPADGDQISFLYEGYPADTLCAASFDDDTSKNPTGSAVNDCVENAEKMQTLLSEEIYKNEFKSGAYVPGIEDTYALYSIYSLVRAGFKADEFYNNVYQKIAKQFCQIKKYGKTPVQISTTDADGNTTTIQKDISEESILASGTASAMYAKTALLISALGKDPTNVCGYDIIDKLALKSVYEKSANSYSKYANDGMILFAIDSEQYGIPTGDEFITRDELVNALVSDVEKQIGTGIKWKSPDGAAMAIQALAPYTNEEYNGKYTSAVSAGAVSKACNKVFSYIENSQDTDGKYCSYGSSNAWSLAQIMITAGSFGINVLDETDGHDFIKNGKTLFDSASDFVDVSGKKVDESLMSFQPEQLLRGLNACIRVCNGSNLLFDTKGSITCVSDYVDDGINPYVTSTPSVTATATATTTTTTTTPATTSATTKSAATTSAATTSATTLDAIDDQITVRNISFAKSKVVIAPGKAVKVKYTVKKGVATGKIIKVSSSSKKIATVSKTDSNYIKIKVPKNAIRGSKAVITLKKGADYARLNVYVQNKVKKIKSVNKAVTVNKGKSIKQSYTMVLQNNKKNTTDNMSIKTSKSGKKKIASIKNVKINGNKLTYTVKGVKKGTDTITIKAGNKKYKAKVTVE